ncbi:hypothetical protein FRC11_005270 [Ceratobasidium sp. 423]|nr:hypothetical protein FRC11_005270 [Ceratobasidium sp. 423]
MVITAPDVIKTIFDGHAIEPEQFRLDTENHSAAGKDKVIVRALDGFVFLKDGKFVYPAFTTSTAEWWQGVEAYGYTAALTGDFRYFIWAGRWGEDFDGKHMEVVHIPKPVGICKEASKHWRQGEEDILWLESNAGFSYALLEPAEEYDLGRWAGVTHSWTYLPAGGSQCDPTFTSVDRKDEKPSWWKGPSAQMAWDHFMGPIKETVHKEAELKHKKAAAESKCLKAQGKVQTTGRGKAKEVNPSTIVSPTKQVSSASPSARSKRKREEPGYDSTRFRECKPVNHIEIDEEDEEGGKEEDADEDADEEAKEDKREDDHADGDKGPTLERTIRRSRLQLSLSKAPHSSPNKAPRPPPRKASKPIRISPSKGAQEMTLSCDDEAQSSMTPNNQGRLGQGGKVGAGGKSNLEQPASSQPTRAMEG